MTMKWTLVAGFACGLALLLGACSSNNNAASGTTGTTGGTTGPDSGNGSGDNEGTEAQRKLLSDAVERYTAARDLITEAERLAGLAARENADAAARDAATKAIADARGAITAAVTAAQAAVDGLKDGAPATLYGRALTHQREKVNDELQTRGTATLNGLLGDYGWYATQLVRYAMLPREIDEPSDGVNTATIVRTPRTVDTSDSDSTQKVNDRPEHKDNIILANEFSVPMYEAGDKVFSGGNDDEFKVDGYVGHGADWTIFDQDLQTGLKITTTGIEIRTGGRRTSRTNAQAGWHETDYLDMRKKINEALGDTTNVGTAAGNAWDLKITFNEPRPRAIGGVRTNWFGNGDYYWRAIVDPHPDQLDSTKTDVYVADTFTQSAGNKNLGTYEVWLSNNIGVNTQLEPGSDDGAIRCPNGELSSASNGACPDDDDNFYLDYAAYGLFMYNADPKALDSVAVTNPGGPTTANWHTVAGSRIQSMYLGYAAFADSSGQRIRDIGTAIDKGEFRGRTLVRAFATNARNPGLVDPEDATNRFLRGDVTLTVNIGKGDSSTANIKGEVTDFEEWNRNAGTWVMYPEGFKVYMNQNGNSDGAAVTIGADGTFNGVAKFAQVAGPAVGSMPALDPRITPPTDGTGGTNGAIHGGGSGGDGGVFKGNFYGDRSKSSDLEVAGSWGMGPMTALGATATGRGYKFIGSFGAKQRPEPPAAGN